MKNYRRGFWSPWLNNAYPELGLRLYFDNPTGRKIVHQAQPSTAGTTLSTSPRKNAGLLSEKRLIRHLQRWISRQSECAKLLRYHVLVWETDCNFLFLWKEWFLCAFRPFLRDLLGWGCILPQFFILGFIVVKVLFEDFLFFHSLLWYRLWFSCSTNLKTLKLLSKELWLFWL